MEISIEVNFQKCKQLHNTNTEISMIFNILNISAFALCNIFFWEIGLDKYFHDLSDFFQIF